MIDQIRHFLYRAKYRFGRHLDLTAPIDVSLELASVCNQRCVYCYHADQPSLPFKKGLMNTEIAVDIIRQAADLGVPSIKFNYRGESTMHPKYSQITALAKEFASGSTFIDRLTNSNFKFQTTRDDIFNGLCNQTKVKVSFDSFRKDIFEKQRAGGIHELALANVDRFYNHPSRRKTELVIQAVRTRLNADEDLEGFVRRRWPSATASIRDMVEGRVGSDLADYKQRSRGEDRRSCLQAHVRLIFDHEGNAQACCPDIGSKIRFGNIQHKSLHAMFNSDEAKQLRSSLKNGTAFDKDPCKTCSSFESYKGWKPNWNS